MGGGPSIPVATSATNNAVKTANDDTKIAAKTAALNEKINAERKAKDAEEYAINPYQFDANGCKQGDSFLASANTCTEKCPVGFNDIGLACNGIGEVRSKKNYAPNLIALEKIKINELYTLNGCKLGDTLNPATNKCSIPKCPVGTTDTGVGCFNPFGPFISKTPYDPLADAVAKNLKMKAKETGAVVAKFENTCDDFDKYSYFYYHFCFLILSSCLLIIFLHCYKLKT